MELRFDPDPPKFSVQNLKLSVSRGAVGKEFNGRSYGRAVGVGLKGQPAPRLYVPTSYTDLALDIRVVDGPVGCQPTATAGAADTGCFEITLKGERLNFSDSVQLPEGTDLARVSLAKLMGDILPVPTPEGTALSLSCRALDLAGEAAGENPTTSEFNFAIVAGPDVTKLLQATLQKVEGGRARVYARPGVALNPYRFFWKFTGQGALQSAEVPDGGQRPYVEFAIPREAQTKKTLSLFAIEEERVVYPGEDLQLAAKDLPRLASWASRPQTVEIPAEVNIGGLRIKARDAAVEPENGRVLWRTKELPLQLALEGSPEELAELDANATTWRLGDDELANGLQAEIKTAGTKTIEIVTKWKQRRRLEIQVEHSPALDLLQKLRLEQGSDVIEPRGKDNRELHVRRGKDLRLVWTVDSYVQSVTANAELTDVQPKRLDDTFVFELPTFREGVYAFAFEGTDRFGSVEQEEDVILLVHDAWPKVEVPNRRPQEEEWGRVSAMSASALPTTLRVSEALKLKETGGNYAGNSGRT